jgi:hypothetical protein
MGFSNKTSAGGFMMLISFLILALSCVPSFAALILRPAPPSDTDVEVTTIPADNSDVVIVPEPHDDALHEIDKEAIAAFWPVLSKRQRDSAGLFWGPFTINDYKFYMTNTHNGYAGPKFPNANHANFHCDKKAPRNKWKAVFNLHIVKYTRGKQECIYMWDSVTRKVVLDKCFTNFINAIPEAVKAIKDFLGDHRKEIGNILKFLVLVGEVTLAAAAIMATIGVVALA